MKRLTKIKGILIAALTVIATLCIGVGCDFTTVDDIKKEYGLSPVVHYYANGGSFGGNLTSMQLYYKTGALPVDLGNTDKTQVEVTSGSMPNMQREGYDFIGWYKAVLNTDGLPVFYKAVESINAFGQKTIEKGEVVESEKSFKEDEVFFVDYDEEVPMDFSQPLKENESVYLCAHWERSEQLDVKLLCVNEDGVETSVFVSDESGTTEHKKGDLLFNENYDRNGQVWVGTEQAPVFDGYTFMDYYDKEGNVVDWNLIQRTGTGVNEYVYAKYLVGEWTLLKEANDLGAVCGKSVAETEKFFLLNDIDCTGVSFTLSPNVVFAGTLNGNGKTLTGLEVKTSTSYSGVADFSLFGTLASTATLKNLTLKDVVVRVDGVRRTSASLNVNYFCKEIQDGATVSGVKIDGGRLTANLKNTNVTILNIADIQTNWLGTDSEGIEVVTSPTLNVKDKNSVE